MTPPRIAQINECYWVTDDGRIFSAARRKWKQLKTPINDRGHPHARLKHGVFRVHTLVLTAFHGPRKAGQVCRHLNGDKTDNRLANLVWGTHKEIMMDIINSTGFAHTKLSREDIYEIQRLRLEGLSQSAIARKFNVAPSTINQIVLKKRRTHMKDDPR